MEGFGGKRRTLFYVAHAPNGLLSHAMAAMPPLFLFLAFELLMRQLRSEVTRSSRVLCLKELEEEIAGMSAKANWLSGHVQRLEYRRSNLKTEVKNEKSASVRDLLDKASVAKQDKIFELWLGKSSST